MTLILITSPVSEHGLESFFSFDELKLHVCILILYFLILDSGKVFIFLNNKEGKFLSFFSAYYLKY